MANTLLNTWDVSVAFKWRFLVWKRSVTLESTSCSLHWLWCRICSSLTKVYLGQPGQYCIKNLLVSSLPAHKEAITKLTNKLKHCCLLLFISDLLIKRWLLKRASDKCACNNSHYWPRERQALAGLRVNWLENPHRIMKHINKVIYMHGGTTASVHKTNLSLTNTCKDTFEHPPPHPPLLSVCVSNSNCYRVYEDNVKMSNISTACWAGLLPRSLFLSCRNSFLDLIGW